MNPFYINKTKLLKHFQKLLSLSMFAVMAIWLHSCANPGMPTGGAKDIIPPKVVKSEPANFSKNFKGDKIKIYFDEFVKSKDLTKQLLISPPMDEQPEIDFKGKYVQIKLLSELLDSTTYTINFGDAIVDNNEGNPIKDFQFVFATGNEIDSLQIGGFLKDAKTNAPKEGVLVMLYKNKADSVPYNELPVYVSRTNKQGTFHIKNISATDYKLFALKDNNQNYLFDQPSEEIAFIDSFLTPYAELFEKTDTIHLDTLGNDSLVVRITNKYYPDSIMLQMFQEIYHKQYLKSKERPERNQLILAFNESLTDSFSMETLNFDLTNDNHLFDVNPTNDSLIYWITDTTLANKDSLLVLVNYLGLDTLDQPAMISDTIKFVYREKKKKKTDPLIPSLNFALLPTKVLHLNDTVKLTFEKPLLTIDTSKIRLEVKADTIYNSLAYELIKDSTDFKKYELKAAWQPANNYRIAFDSLAFISFDGLTNDSTGFSLETKDLEFYGKIIVNLQHSNEQVILLLMDNKDNELRRMICPESKKYEFELLEAKSFKLRIIIDENKNGKWDTGNYHKNIQPERVVNYTQEIKVKANWDMELDWKIETPKQSK